MPVCLCTDCGRVTEVHWRPYDSQSWKCLLFDPLCKKCAASLYLTSLLLKLTVRVYFQNTTLTIRRPHCKNDCYTEVCVGGLGYGGEAQASSDLHTVPLKQSQADSCTPSNWRSAWKTVASTKTQDKGDFLSPGIIFWGAGRRGGVGEPVIYSGY